MSLGGALGGRDEAGAASTSTRATIAVTSVAPAQAPAGFAQTRFLGFSWARLQLRGRAGGWGRGQLVLHVDAEFGAVRSLRVALRPGGRVRAHGQWYAPSLANSCFSTTVLESSTFLIAKISIPRSRYRAARCRAHEPLSDGVACCQRTLSAWLQRTRPWQWPQPPSYGEPGSCCQRLGTRTSCCQADESQTSISRRLHDRARRPRRLPVVRSVFRQLLDRAWLRCFPDRVRATQQPACSVSVVPEL